MSEDQPNGNVVPIDKNTREGENDLKRRFWTDVLYQLTGSKRFLDFIDGNYIIQKGFDEEAKTVEVRVIEKPVSVGPSLSPGQQLDIHNACVKSGARQPRELMEKILKLLGQDAPTIQLASDADLADALAQRDLKEKLDA